MRIECWITDNLWLCLNTNWLIIVSLMITKTHNTRTSAQIQPHHWIIPHHCANYCLAHAFCLNIETTKCGAVYDVFFFCNKSLQHDSNLLHSHCNCYTRTKLLFSCKLTVVTKLRLSLHCRRRPYIKTQSYKCNFEREMYDFPENTITLRWFEEANLIFLRNKMNWHYTTPSQV